MRNIFLVDTVFENIYVFAAVCLPSSSGLIHIDVPSVVSLSAGKNTSAQCKCSDFYVKWFHIKIDKVGVSTL